MSFLLFAIILGLYADSEIPIDPRQIAAAEALDALRAVESPEGFEITELDFFIEGSTLDWALAKRLEIEVGDTFQSAEDLVAALKDQNQILTNQRVLERGWVEAILT